MKIKICSICKKERLISEFYHDKRAKDKLCSECKKCNIIRAKKYQQKHKAQLKKYHIDYYQTHKEQINNYQKQYQIDYRRIHKVQIHKYHKKYQNNRLKKDPNFKILCCLRSRIWAVLKGICKSATTIKLLGCSIEKFKKYYESKFTVGMNWNKVMNGEIHIDHIIPCASFDLSKKSEQKKCFHYTNLQPLWAKENLIKYDKT